jgi:hypothetical protein
MTKILIEEATLKLAMEALNTTESDCGSRAWEREQEAITAIKQALAAPTVQEPVAWADAYAISNLPAVDEAIRALLDDKTADNATAVVQAILGAVPPEQPAPVQETCRECAGEGIQGEDGDGFVSGVTWRCDSCNGTGKSTPPAAQRQWVGLPDDDVYLLAHPRLARAIETKLKEKNT